MKVWRSALFGRKGALLSLLVKKSPRWSLQSTATVAALIFSSLAALLALSGCVPSEPKADLVIVNGAEPESLDPAIVTGQPDLRVVDALFEGLTRLDPKTVKPVPAIAAGWDIAESGTVYTFHLRHNARWSTGEPITASDVVYSWRRAVSPATASDYAGQLFFIKNAEAINSQKIRDASQLGAQALDPYTLRVELVSPTAFFLDLCAFPTLAVVPRQAIEKHGDRWLLARPVPTSGAFTLEFWRIHDKIRVRKNPYYWNAAETRSGLVDFLPIEAQNTALNIYETGAADIIWDKGLVPTELLDVLSERPDYHSFDYLGIYFIRCNVTRKPFDDPRVRKALAMAIDKRRIVERITRGGEKPATHYTPPGIKNYDPPSGLGYDPDEARRLLAEAGYPGGEGFPVFQYMFNSSKMHEQIAIELKEMWRKELGITMELRQKEWKVFLAEQSAVNYDLARASWIGDYNDPNTFLDMFMSNNGNNGTGWKNARYDQLMREGNRQTDPGKRAALLREAETILVQDDLPVIPLYYYVGVNFYDPQAIHGIYQNILDEHPIYPIWKSKRP